MPKHHGKRAAGGGGFKKTFQRKLKIDFGMAKRGTLRAGAGHHGPPKSRAQVIAIAASQAHKIVNNRRKRKH